MFDVVCKKTGMYRLRIDAPRFYFAAGVGGVRVKDRPNALEDYQVYQDDDSVIFTYKQSTIVSTYRIFPGVLLGFNDIRTRELPPIFPNASLFTSGVALRVNFSVEGICELFTHEGNYVYIKGGNVVISRARAAKPFNFPTGAYSGIELYILDEAVTKEDGLLDSLGVNIAGITDTYLKDQPTLIANMDACLSAPVQALMTIHSNPAAEFAQLRFNSLSLLHALSTGRARLVPANLSALTLPQINAAKAMERSLTRDLSVRISISEIARSVRISESSLKSWFKAVYGKNVSDYMRDRRIAEAKRLLKETNMRISEVANAVGFESQSKFTSMFHKACHYSPSEYRKRIAEEDE